MGIVDFVKRGTQQICIRRPDNLKDLIVFKHTDDNIPKWAQLTVGSDEGAVFFKRGQAMGILGAGSHTLDGATYPFLSNLLEGFTGNNVFISELFFVLRRPVRDLFFGDKIEGIMCPVTEEMVDIKVHGEYEAQIVDPVKFITEFAGQHRQAGDNNVIMQDVQDLMKRGLWNAVAEVLEETGRPITQLGRVKNDLCKSIMASVPEISSKYGVAITDIINFTPKIPEDQKARVNELWRELGTQKDRLADKQARRKAQAAAVEKRTDKEVDFEFDAKYSNMAGGYQNYAQAQAMMGAGEGMAKGGSNIGMAQMGAQMAVGVGMGGGMASMFQQPGMYHPAPMQAQPVQGAAACGKCGHQNPNGGKFCANCGGGLAPPPAQKVFCSNCGSQVAGKFCPNCGTSLGGPQGGPPQGMPPQGAPPQGMPPQGMPPQGAAPQGGYPQAQHGQPQAAQAGYPQAPQAGYPQAPQGGYPQAPQGGYPRAPQGGHYAPPQGAPPQGAPPQGAPPQGSPPQGAPPQGAPPQGGPPQGGGQPPQGGQG